MGGSSTSSTGTTKSKTGAASLRTDAFTVSIPKGMAEQAAQAAKSMGITKAQLVKRALADMLEDIQDAKIIEERRYEKGIPWEKVKTDLGL